MVSWLSSYSLIRTTIIRGSLVGRSYFKLVISFARRRLAVSSAWFNFDKVKPQTQWQSWIYHHFHTFLKPPTTTTNRRCLLSARSRGIVQFRQADGTRNNFSTGWGYHLACKDRPPCALAMIAIDLLKGRQPVALVLSCSPVLCSHAIIGSWCLVHTSRPEPDPQRLLFSP